MTATLTEIIACLDQLYPFSWAVPGDRVGLEVGHPDTPVDTVLVALEATPGVVAEAQQLGAQLLLTHHPLLYQPLKAVREDEPGGRLLALLIRARLALVACHTNLDVAPGGLNDYLAELLELHDTQVLAETAREPCYKLTVFVPTGYEDRVRTALAAEGLGVIGRYSHCSFAARGQGTYVPLEGARPFRGETAQISRAEESRLEMVTPESLVPAALARLQESHPYEEVAYDLYPLKNPGVPRGLGRIGNYSQPRPFSQVISQVKATFGVSAVRVWGSPPPEVRRAAVCGGSGGDLLREARAQGAQVYLTGEVRHHQLPPGDLEDFAVLEVGHFASEVIFMGPWALKLQGHFQEAGLPLRVASASAPTAPSSFW